MSEKIMKEVMFADDDHVWIDGKQFVSIKRFLESKNATIKETMVINERLEKITEENEALKVLLKNRY